jgi:hypothetical protein
METNHPVNTKAYVRAWVAIALFISWGISAFTGFLLWAAPSGFRSGRSLLLFELSKGQWDDIHFWFSVAAIAITVIHIIIDWRVLTACMRLMASTYRGKIEC